MRYGDSGSGLGQASRGRMRRYRNSRAIMRHRRLGANYLQWMLRRNNQLRMLGGRSCGHVCYDHLLLLLTPDHMDNFLALVAGQVGQVSGGRCSLGADRMMSAVHRLARLDLLDGVNIFWRQLSSRVALVDDNYFVGRRVRRMRNKMDLLGGRMASRRHMLRVGRGVFRFCARDGRCADQIAYVTSRHNVEIEEKEEEEERSV